jgi:hypothetical protein
MSQLIACKNRNGIIIAADTKGIDFNLSGEMIELNVNRMIQLSSSSAILTGGAAAGEKMCQALKSFVEIEGLDDVEGIYGAALPFLASEYEGFMRKECEMLPLDPVHHVHFILAGYTGKDEQDPYRLYLLWTKKKLPLLDGDEISTAFSIPRSMRLEYKLNQLCKENAELDRILPEVQKTMEELSKTQEEIGAPFSYAMITNQGFKTI